jgi:hypothetical protein
LGFWNTIEMRMRTSIGSTSACQQVHRSGSRSICRRSDARVQVVHAVEAAQEGRLAAARGPISAVTLFS